MNNKLFDLTGRVALVTGGSKGLGKAMARGFAEAGADVVISSRSEGELAAAAPGVGTGRRGGGLAGRWESGWAPAARETAPGTRVAWVVAALPRRDETVRLAREAQAA